MRRANHYSDVTIEPSHSKRKFGRRTVAVKEKDFDSLRGKDTSSQSGKVNGVIARITRDGGGASLGDS